MKNIISIALFVAVFGLVGCSAQEKPDTTAHRDYTASSANHRPACKGHKCHGKLGVEQTENDTNK